VAAGRARILAVTSEKRSVAFPDAPALAERGFPGFDFFDWNGLFAASGTPQPIIARMHEAMVQACRDARVKERLEPLGAEMVGNTSAEFSAWLTNQRKEMGQILIDAGVKLQ
jgi:tripartite-type tricarboxylate transporter receptor subunit TctC